MLRALADAYTQAGVTVFGAAPTARAARELRDSAGVDAGTLHALAGVLDQRGGFPRGSVLLEQKPSFAALPASPADVHPRLVKFALNEVALIVQTPRPGLLVCSESNMKGWTATVDRQPVPIMAANYAFRAVEVPPGAHAIRFVYHAPGFIAGVALTILGSFLCFAGLVKAESRDKR